MKSQTSNLQHRTGFTLVELLVVIAIIVVLLAMLTPALDRSIYQAGLAACGAGLRAVATGATIYAMDHQRRYVHRPGVFASGDGFWQADELQDDTGLDDRPKLQGYIDLKLLVDPLCPKVDLSAPAAPANTYVISSYNLRFGYQFFPPAPGGPTPGMFRIGQRLGWSDGTGEYSFSILASDEDRTSLPSPSFTLSSHPDTEDVMAPQALQNSGAFNVSRYIVFGRFTRGTVDLNYAYEDGAVLRFDAVAWDDYQTRDRMVRVPNYNHNPNTDEWHHMPL